ncbi:site-2 protease family protein [Nocardioides donggukensis]|uniref:site-2 protease family protein n=1 Tax=Nocardioides donggukensis TaxID=2774019 RepID=UPI00191ED74A|nr:site-2 protease family protein [Nocardioides donggukensis]
MSENAPGSPTATADRRPRPPGTLRIGKVAGVDVLITPSWFLIAALLAIVLAPIVERSQPGLGPWRYLAGFAFAVLLYLSVLLHEASHAVMAQRFGHPVSSITLHFLGGMTAIEGESRRPREEFWIAVVGPLTSIAVGVVSWLAWQVLPGGLIGLAVGGLAAANLLVGVLNLVPGLPLDGGRVLKAGVWSLSGNMHRGTIAAGWGGRLTAVAVLAWPLLGERLFGTRPQLVDYLLVFVIALFLWTGATAAMQGARMRRELPSLVARDLARRTLAVPGDLPVAEAVRRAQEAGAGGIVTVSGSGTPVGIVNEGALLATPEDRRPWMAVSSIARTIEDGLSLPVDIVGEDLIRAITRVPAHEYLLVEKGGEVYGVLTTADVDRAFSQRHR